MVLDLLDSKGVSTDAISGSDTYTLKVTLANADGSAAAKQLVTVSGNTNNLSFLETSNLTESDGVAKFRVKRISVTSSGAEAITAFYDYKASGATTTTTLTQSYNYKLGQVSVELGALTAATSNIAAYGTTTVSVNATVNKVAPVSPLLVTFSASCGSVSPSSVLTNAAGTSTTTYIASVPACGGQSVTVTASISGASSSPTAQIKVAAVQPTNIQFISATPTSLSLKTSQQNGQSALLKFKVLDAGGKPITNSTVTLALSNKATGVGLQAPGNQDAKDVDTDENGEVTATVFAGTVPSNLSVIATVKGSNPSISTESSILAVTSGPATQERLSLALGAISIEGYSIDGVTTPVTLSLSDRQGNPVLPGTVINFVTEFGTVSPGQCVMSAANPFSCSVTYSSSGARPTITGRVSILAYLAGEEDFVDANFNNIYDVGESFTDLGVAYRDNNASSVLPDKKYNLGEFMVPRVGVPNCDATTGTCSGDGKWGQADIRQQAQLVLATSVAELALASGSSLAPGADGVITATLLVKDQKGNSMPTGSTIAVSVVADGPTFGDDKKSCSLTTKSPVTVLGTLDPYSLEVGFKNCAPGNEITVAVTTPRGSETSFPVKLR